MCKNLYIPAMVERALSEGFHSPGWDFILGRQLLSRLGKSGRKKPKKTQKKNHLKLMKTVDCELLPDRARGYRETRY